MAAAQEPRLRVAPQAAKTYGDIAGEMVARWGLAPDVWQQGVLDDWLAEGANGKWASLTCGLSVPRQNGKNALIEMREVVGMVWLGEKFLHTAHEVKTARKAFKRLQHFFGTKVDDPGANFPNLNKMVTEVRNVNGQEAIFLSNGGSVEVVARSKNSGRGFTVDVLIMDEAQEMSDDDLEALMPTTSAAPLGNPQWLFTGTPPGPRASGEVFTRVRSEAVDAPSKRLCWHEWSAEPASNLDDLSIWRATNPALVTGRLQLEVVAGERARFSDDGFARERLGMWSTVTVARAVIAQGAWEARNVGDGDPTEPPTALALDRWFDGSTSIAGAWRTDDNVHVELVAADRVKDTAGVVDLVATMAGRRIPVLIASDSPAASLIPDLTARKVKVVTVSASDYGRSCVSFVDELANITHAGQERLNEAVAGGIKRRIGSAGLWGWDRARPDVDISGLVAATLAHHGAKTARRRSTKPQRIVVLT